MKKMLMIPFLSLLISPFNLAFNAYASEELAVSIKEVSPFTYCCIHHKGPFTEIEKAIGQLMQAVREQNIIPMGPLVGVYYNDPNEVKPEDLEWEVGFPITQQVPVRAPLEKKEWSFTSVATALHVGPYEETGQSYLKIFKWLQTNNYIQSGPVMEKYLDDPSQVKPEKLQTEIWVPCKKENNL